MAWTKVQTGTYSGGATNSTTLVLTLGAAVGAGNAICGCAEWDGPPGATLVSIVDDKGNNYNAETVIKHINNDEYSCAFSLTNITNGPSVITLTISIASGSQGMIVDEFSGGSTASTDERDVHGGQYLNSTGGTDGATSGSFTTTVNGDLIWSCVQYAFGFSATIGTGFTAAGALSGDLIATEYRTQTTAGSGTAGTWTIGSSASGVMYMIALKPSAGGDVLMAQIWL